MSRKLSPPPVNTKIVDDKGIPNQEFIRFLLNTQNETLNGSVPIGGIIMYSGEEGSLPRGWKLCNGENDTPNLVDKFILGVGYDNIGEEGGTLEATMPEHSHDATHDHTASSAEDGEHTHDLILDDKARFGSGEEYTPRSSGTAISDLVPAGGAHSHSITVDEKDLTTSKEGGDGDNRPPYYTLAYIMRMS